jgi:hypothetical protein
MLEFTSPPRWMSLILALALPLSGSTSCSPRPATTKGPFRDVAHPGPCIIDREGAMQCWGGVRRAQLDVPGPQRLSSGRDIVCAELAAGGQRCWTMVVQQGGAVFVPFSIPQLDSPRQVISDAGRNCALQADGKVLCWSRLAPEPQVVAGASGARQVDIFVDPAARCCPPAALSAGHLARKTPPARSIRHGKSPGCRTRSNSRSVTCLAVRYSVMAA